jgi:hypothetical protein
MPGAERAMPGQGPTLQQMLERLPGRHLAWPLLLCTLLAAVPGLQLGWVCAPALCWIVRALWQGQEVLELPERVARSRLSPPAATRLLAWAGWLHVRMARWCRPRWATAARALGGRWAAALVATMSILILLPIPGSNLLPALALLALAAGLLRRDGAAITLAWCLAATSLGLLAGIGWLGLSLVSEA